MKFVSVSHMPPYEGDVCIGHLDSCREKKEHRGEKQRESQLWSEAQDYNVERKGPALPSGDILRCLVTALHAVKARPAGGNSKHPTLLFLPRPSTMLPFVHAHLM